jgi:excisionase family DNA binding protein
MAYVHVRPVVAVAMSPSRAAASTGLRQERISAAVRAGEIRAVRVGVKTLILKSELERWLMSHAPASRRSISP